VLSHVFELWSEVQIFLSGTTSGLSNRFTDEMWLFHWPTCQIHFAISVSLMTAYGVSTLLHSQSMTKQKLPEKTWFHYQRSRK
jgi:hypothetical protein